jgi:hypothetical protein
MPSRSRQTGRHPDEHADRDASDQQEQTAAELSDRAAESVDRGYDATKEVHLDEPVRRQGGSEPFKEQTDRQERDRGHNEGGGTGKS